MAKKRLQSGAKRRIEQLARKRAKQFDGPFFYSNINQIVGNTHTSKNPLAALLDTIQTLHDLGSNSDVSESIQDQASTAARQLDRKVQQLADERTAIAVAYTYHDKRMTELDDISQEDAREVTQEAEEWLEEHTELAERVSAWDEKSVSNKVYAFRLNPEN